MLPQERAEALDWLATGASVEHLPVLFEQLGRPDREPAEALVGALVRVARGAKGPRRSILRALTRAGARAGGATRALVFEAAGQIRGMGEPAVEGATAPAPTRRPKKMGSPGARVTRRLVVAREVASDEFPYLWDYSPDDHDFDHEYEQLPRFAGPHDDGLECLNEVARWVDRYNDALHRPSEAPSGSRLADCVSEGQHERLRALVIARQAPQGGELPEAARRFAARLGLGGSSPAAIDSLAGLAVRAVARGCGAGGGWVDWEAQARALCDMLGEAPPEGEEEWRVLAAHEAIFEGPEALRERLRKGRWHDGWLPLAPWLALALGRLPEASLLRAARGSWLALRCVRRAIEAPHAVTDDQGHGLAGIDLALAAGGGSMQAQAYPSFRVVCRLSMAEPSDTQREGLLEIFGQLRQLHDLVQRPAHGLAVLLSRCAPGLLAAGGEEACDRLLASLESSLLAALWLRSSPAFASVRLRRSHLTEFWRRPLPERFAPSLARMQQAYPPHVRVEALVAALMAELNQRHFEDEGPQASLKEALLEMIRLASLVYQFEPGETFHGEDAGRRLLNVLIARFDHAPRELVQALGLDPRQGLSRLRGGQLSGLEQRFHRALREVQRGRRGAQGEGEVLSCRPLSKAQALRRGELGRDCSSSSVPLRALSPHHVYYGLFSEQGDPLPGYLTVFEAWARLDDGSVEPVLCLETINEPRGYLAGAQQDLLLLFGAIARSRGLSARLVLIHGTGTWNYANGYELARCRRARQGSPVTLAPADPVVFRAYAGTCHEARYYSSFGPPGPALLRPAGEGPRMVALAPFDPALEHVQPENEEEARRIAALPARSLIWTCLDREGPVGFISSWPR